MWESTALAPQDGSIFGQQGGTLVVPDAGEAAGWYEKALDLQSGQYYYRNTVTGEVTWDKPGGQIIPMAPLSPEREEELRQEMSMTRIERHEEQEIRSVLVQRRFEEQKAEGDKRARDKAKAEAEALARIWDTAIDAAKETGTFVLTWKKLGYVRQDVLEFRARYGRHLESFRLVGHELTAIPEDLCTKLISLQSLHLPNNHLTRLPDSIGRLTNLTELNVLRNRLERLPASIGDMLLMENLLIANNRLVELPGSIANMTRLASLNLECNQLTKLPDTIKRMTNLTRINANKNQLVLLPNCLKFMTGLEVVSVNDNKLRYLPNNIGESRSIRAIHASTNQIMELPDSIGQLETLEELWLDSNHMTALPMTFFSLTRLRDLRLAGNNSMVHPTLEVVSRGVPTVLKWCALRHHNSKASRQRIVMTSLLDCLQQVKDNNLASPAQFEPDVTRNGLKWYALQLEQFFTDIMPRLEDYWETPKGRREPTHSFPYRPQEVIMTVYEFLDADGPVVMSGNAMFKRCACVDQDGKARRCVPPQVGFQCLRDCTLIRMSITLEMQLAERKKTEMEQAAIATSVAAARLAALEYCNEREVKVQYREKAEKRAPAILKKRAMARFNRLKAEEMDKRKKDVHGKYEGEIKRLLASRLTTFNRMQEEKEALIKEWEAAVGWSRGLLEKRIELLFQRMEQLPEDDQFEALLKKRDEDMDNLDAVLAKEADKKTLWKQIRGNASELEEVIEEVMAELVEKKVSKEEKKAREKAEEEHRRMRRIMASWAGLGLRDTFILWKHWAKTNKTRRAMDRYKQALQQQRDYEATLVGLTMAQWEVAKWKKEWDMYHDVWYYVNQKTGETRSDAPTVEEFMPRNYTPPNPLDPETLAIIAEGPPKVEGEKIDQEGGGGGKMGRRSPSGDGLEVESDAGSDDSTLETLESNGDEVKDGDSVGVPAAIEEEEDTSPIKMPERDIQVSRDIAAQRAMSLGPPGPQTQLHIVKREEASEEDEIAAYLAMVPAETKERALVHYEGDLSKFEESVVEVQLGKKDEVKRAEEQFHAVQDAVRKRMKRLEKIKKDPNRRFAKLDAKEQRELLAEAIGFDKNEDYDITELQEFARKALEWNRAHGITAHDGVGEREEGDEAFWFEDKTAALLREKAQGLKQTVKLGAMAVTQRRKKPAAKPVPT